MENAINALQKDLLFLEETLPWVLPLDCSRYINDVIIASRKD